MEVFIVLFFIAFTVNGVLYEECGLVTYGINKVLIAGGSSAQRGEVPWHAAIYTKATTPYKQICGGSLISTNVIISAAHCFWSDYEKQLPAVNYAVSVGKLFRPWQTDSSTEEDKRQRSDVKEIHLPVRFRGEEANNQEDIAIVVVSKQFECTTYVRPVCVDFDNTLENTQLQPGNKGKVAGWGLTSENGVSAQILQVIELPFVNTNTCIYETPYTFQSHITSDKFCAGYKNANQSVCKGDSGGGLVFLEYDEGQTRHYLRGIVSSAIASDDNNKCNVNHYTGFTWLTKHEHFIKDIWRKSNNNDNETRCVLQSSELKRGGCGWSHPRAGENGTSGGGAQYGEFPWVCAVLETVTEENRLIDKYLCNGALIHPSAVLVAGYHMSNLLRYKVRAGLWRGGKTAGLVQLRDVASIEASSKSVYTLLFLTEPMTRAPNVAVACLPPPGQRVPPGTSCVETRWDHASNVEYNYEAILLKVEMLVAEHAICERWFIQSGHYSEEYKLEPEENCLRLNGSTETRSEKLCRQIRRYSVISCAAESAGGRYVLSGFLPFTSNCDKEQFWVYHELSALRTWIDEKITAGGYDPKVYNIEPHEREATVTQL